MRFRFAASGFGDSSAISPTMQLSFPLVATS
jgi:hypothetical protein